MILLVALTRLRMRYSRTIGCSKSFEATETMLELFTSEMNHGSASVESLVRGEGHGEDMREFEEALDLFPLLEDDDYQIIE